MAVGIRNWVTGYAFRNFESFLVLFIIYCLTVYIFMQEESICDTDSRCIGRISVFGV